MHLQLHDVKKHNILYNQRNFNILLLFILFLCILPLQAQNIQEYFQIVCSKKQTKFCKNIKDLLHSLEILEKIQINNVKFLQKNKFGQMPPKGLDYHQLQKEHIVFVSYEEYLLLKESLKRFCKSFKKLRNNEKNILFSLLWNEKLLFENESDILTFCKQKH